MKRLLALFAGLCLALGTAGCGQGSERLPEATEPPAYRDAGTEAMGRGDWAAAVDAFSRAIEADDGRAAAYAGRADSYLALYRAGETDVPDLKGLALRDYELALTLDPALGERIYETCAQLGAEALEAGSVDEALCWLRTAEQAAPAEAGERIRRQAKTLTDEALMSSDWYRDAPDSEYYAFDPDGTGRTVSAVTMEQTGAFAYRNDGFTLQIFEDGAAGQWTYDPDLAAYRQDAAVLQRMPEGGRTPSGTLLGEIFPVGEETLLDYLRLTAGWILDGRRLSVQGGADAEAAWRSLSDVEHYFQDGRLYLCLDGAVTDGEDGRLVVETPLYAPGDMAVTGEELLSRLCAERWISLWETGYDDEVLFLELALEPDGTCTARGGPYPGAAAGVQSGQYALEGDELTLTLNAEGYSAGTCRYRVLPMGDSLYMELLTDGVIYGQAAGSTYVFCGAGYAADAGVRLR